MEEQEISVKYIINSATKACTNKDHRNLRNVIGKARQSLVLGVSQLKALRY